MTSRGLCGEDTEQLTVSRQVSGVSMQDFPEEHGGKDQEKRKRKADGSEQTPKQRKLDTERKKKLKAAQVLKESEPELWVFGDMGELQRIEGDNCQQQATEPKEVSSATLNEKGSQQKNKQSTAMCTFVGQTANQKDRNTHHGNTTPKRRSFTKITGKVSAQQGNVHALAVSEMAVLPLNKQKACSKYPKIQGFGVLNVKAIENHGAEMINGPTQLPVVDERMGNSSDSEEETTMIKSSPTTMNSSLHSVEESTNLALKSSLSSFPPNDAQISAISTCESDMDVSASVTTSVNTSELTLPVATSSTATPVDTNLVMYSTSQKDASEMEMTVGSRITTLLHQPPTEFSKVSPEALAEPIGCDTNSDSLSEFDRSSAQPDTTSTEDATHSDFDTLRHMPKKHPDELHVDIFVCNTHDTRNASYTACTPEQTPQVTKQALAQKKCSDSPFDLLTYLHRDLPGTMRTQEVPNCQISVEHLNSEVVDTKAIGTQSDPVVQVVQSMENDSSTYGSVDILDYLNAGYGSVDDQQENNSTINSNEESSDEEENQPLTIINETSERAGTRKSPQSSKERFDKPSVQIIICSPDKDKVVSFVDTSIKVKSESVCDGPVHCIPTGDYVRFNSPQLPFNSIQSAVSKSEPVEYCDGHNSTPLQTVTLLSYNQNTNHIDSSAFLTEPYVTQSVPTGATSQSITGETNDFLIAGIPGEVQMLSQCPGGNPTTQQPLDTQEGLSTENDSELSLVISSVFSLAGLEVTTDNIRKVVNSRRNMLASGNTSELSISNHVPKTSLASSTGHACVQRNLSIPECARFDHRLHSPCSVVLHRMDITNGKFEGINCPCTKSCRQKFLSRSRKHISQKGNANNPTKVIWPNGNFHVDKSSEDISSEHPVGEIDIRYPLPSVQSVPGSFEEPYNPSVSTAFSENGLPTVRMLPSTPTQTSVDTNGKKYYIIKMKGKDLLIPSVPIQTTEKTCKNLLLPKYDRKPKTFPGMQLHNTFGDCKRLQPQKTSTTTMGNCPSVPPIRSGSQTQNISMTNPHRLMKSSSGEFAAYHSVSENTSTQVSPVMAHSETFGSATHGKFQRRYNISLDADKSSSHLKKATECGTVPLKKRYNAANEVLSKVHKALASSRGTHTMQYESMLREKQRTDQNRRDVLYQVAANCYGSRSPKVVFSDT